MKKITILFALVLITSKLIAQDCSKYLFMQPNKQVEMSAFNDKGQLVRKSLLTVKNVSTENGMAVSQVVSEAKNSNGKLSTLTINFKCNNGIIMVDMNFNGAQAAKPTANMKFNYVEYPAGMKVGDHLKDALSPISIVEGSTTFTGTTKITDRTVVAKESITTPAGTWICFKITYKVIAKMDPVKGLQVPTQAFETNATEWFVPNFSVIKTQITGGMTIEITSIK